MTSPQNTNMQSFSNKTCWERWLVVDNQETVDKWQMPADDFEEQMGRILDVTCRAEFGCRTISAENVFRTCFGQTFLMERT